MMTTKYSQKKWSLEGRYRLHIRQQDNETKDMLINRTDHQVRLNWSYTLTPKLTLRTQANAVSKPTEQGNMQGMMLCQEATWKNRWLQIDANFGWFNTDDYNSRIYYFEKSVLYDHTSTMYYGQGIHYTLMAKAELGKRLTLAAKMMITNYFDRNFISSGLQQVDRSSMTDLLVQLRYTL